MDFDFLRLPGFSVVPAAEHGQWCGWMSVFNEDQDVPGPFVDCGSASVNARLGNRNHFAPCFSTVEAAPRPHTLATPSGQHRTFLRDHNVGESTGVKNGVELELRCAYEVAEFSRWFCCEGQ